MKRPAKKTLKRTTETAKETADFAGELLKEFGHGCIWLLSGDLGSGKTIFVKGLGKALCIDETKIKSPTFTFRADHGILAHYDLYRLEKPDELLFEQINEDILSGKTVAIEWPEIFLHACPAKVVKISFTHKSSKERQITVTPPL
ncbi:MAG: tRNA (adenosine(37)-N6)-threonylcarbamoyltransferase complex ATPase subunit type 1 TsaE [Candidatus Gracilibacteria bacterium]|jgi:tRNA threonylcarbamoyladenosine biosynthesis protein TsaE